MEDFSQNLDILPDRSTSYDERIFLDLSNSKPWLDTHYNNFDVINSLDNVKSGESSNTGEEF